MKQRKTTNRYVVFERPRGSKCWTMAYTKNVNGEETPAQFCKRRSAQILVKALKRFYSDRQFYIGIVRLPK
jgi:hypothetical protein